MIKRFEIRRLDCNAEPTSAWEPLTEIDEMTARDLRALRVGQANLILGGGAAQGYEIRRVE